ncbi:hypothetical protein M9991_16870 [Chryseobacterium gallinarum]|uniref:hypothetical protein n=1 Tax=Chryseobacterium gallinarum TaxID=1324352 RepID=UPI002025B53D|nr:hypothetical protein [Chryseobacterium gallinarum]MCL8538542.1 hypothetical protein [Chryseobacterium gallinarum]
MKKLNPGYFEFFFFRYGFIVIFVQIVSLSFYFITEEKDNVPLILLGILCLLFLVFVCSSDYWILRKNLSLANVFLTGNGLIINELLYPAEQIKEVAFIPVRHALNKFPAYFIEITTHDGHVFHFLEKRMGWDFKSPTLKLLNKHPLFSLKTKEKSESSEGFSAFKKQKQSSPKKLTEK